MKMTVFVCEICGSGYPIFSKDSDASKQVYYTELQLKLPAMEGAPAVLEKGKFVLHNEKVNEVNYDQADDVVCVKCLSGKPKRAKLK